ncbi:hypothetical protein [Nakamurella sp.]|uniref:hypothetical protein n=1 Tax=Nakamurella sp. TaxID=1869182 RepID=UPI003B3AB3EF
MGQWWDENIIEPGKLPLLLCFAAFIVTFLSTRIITRLIRAGIGPFKNNVSSSGVHIHHAVPGIILLILGSIMALRGPDSPWIEIAGVLSGIGISLILDEFALILHLQDVYWANEGRISVEMIGLATAVFGFVLLGFSPLGVDEVTTGGLEVRLTFLTAATLHFGLLLICVLKGKYRSALVGCFIGPVAWWASCRLARPNSWWARHRYRKPRKIERARRREAKFQAKWDPRWRWVSDLIAGAPSMPDPAPVPAVAAAAVPGTVPGTAAGPASDAVATPDREGSGRL